MAGCATFGYVVETVRHGPRAGRAPRSVTVRARVTELTRDEIRRLAAAEDRSESDMLRVLLSEALAERARR